jgi:hypothetical protein
VGQYISAAPSNELKEKRSPKRAFCRQHPEPVAKGGQWMEAEFGLTFTLIAIPLKHGEIQVFWEKNIEIIIG